MGQWNGKNWGARRMTNKSSKLIAKKKYRRPRELNDIPVRLSSQP